MKYGKLISGDLVLSKKYLIYNGRKIKEDFLEVIKMWGKLVNNELVLAKKYLIYNGRKIWNAPESLWLEAGWKHVVYGEFPEGYDEYITEYSEDENYIIVTDRGVESE